MGWRWVIRLPTLPPPLPPIEQPPRPGQPPGWARTAAGGRLGEAAEAGRPEVGGSGHSLLRLGEGKTLSGHRERYLKAISEFR